MKIRANQKWERDLVKIGGKQIYKNWRETNLKNGREQISRGGLCHKPPLEKDLEISICSSERQGRVSRPPLKMLFYQPLQTVSVAVKTILTCVSLVGLLCPVLLHMDDRVQPVQTDGSQST